MAHRHRKKGDLAHERVAGKRLHAVDGRHRRPVALHAVGRCHQAARVALLGDRGELAVGNGVEHPRILERDVARQLERTGEAVDFDVVDPDPGDANDDGLFFRFSEGNRVHNLSSLELSPGTYVITIQLPDGRRFDGGFVLR